MRNNKENQQQFGASLMEVLIAILISSIGVLGYVGLQAKTMVTQIEAYQRSQALILISDMTQRMALNKENSLEYIKNDIGIANPSACEMTSASEIDLCEWGRLIGGEAEKLSSKAVGAMIGARGCISNPSAEVYVIAISWQGLQATGPPTNTCGKNSYVDENLRRAVAVTVQFSIL